MKYIFLLLNIVVSLFVCFRTEIFKEKFNRKYVFILIHYFLLNLFSLYLLKTFNENTLFFINLLCLYGLYITSVTDIFEREIFVNDLVFFAVLMAVLNYFGNYMKISILGALSGLFLYLFIYIFGKIIYKKEVFGMGDVYILSFVGFATDWFTVLNIGLFAFVICISFYLAMAFTKGIFSGKFNFIKEMKNYEIPFVPFIAVSYLIFIYFN